MFQGIKNGAKNAFKSAAAPIAIGLLAFAPTSQAEADIVINAQGTVTESTQVFPGTPFDFTATINEDTPDSLPSLSTIGAYQDNPFDNFTLQIGTGINAILIEGENGGEIGITPITDSGFLRVNDFDVNSVNGLPPEFSFESFTVGFDNILLTDDTLITGLNAFSNSANGTFNASLSPTTASGSINSFSVTTTSVPEPSALAVLALGAAGVAARRRRNDNDLTNG